jgi:hypothetical protein
MWPNSKIFTLNFKLNEPSFKTCSKQFPVDSFENHWEFVVPSKNECVDFSELT